MCGSKSIVQTIEIVINFNPFEISYLSIIHFSNILYLDVMINYEVIGYILTLLYNIYNYQKN